MPAPPASAPAPPELTLAATAALLAERFPALFAPQQPKPIKLRIQADIQQRAPGLLTRRALSVFLHRHTTATAYLRALVASPERFDLDGAPAGEVAAEHREAALAEVQRRRQIVEARRAAERQGRRAAQRPIPEQAAAAGPGRRPESPPRGPDRPSGVEVPGHDGGDGRGSPGDQQGRPSGRGNRPAHREEGPLQAGGEGGSGASRRASRHPGPPGRRTMPQGPGWREPRGPPGPRAPRDARERDDLHEPRDARAGVRGEQADRLPDDPASRERAVLLRAWESSPLTQANFCALKGLKVAEFEVQLEQARRERQERAELAAKAARAARREPEAGR